MNKPTHERWEGLELKPLTKTQEELLSDRFEAIKLLARQGEAMCDMSTSFTEVNSLYNSIANEMESLRRFLTDIARINKI